MTWLVRINLNIKASLLILCSVFYAFHNLSQSKMFVYKGQYIVWAQRKIGGFFGCFFFLNFFFRLRYHVWRMSNIGFFFQIKISCLAATECQTFSTLMQPFRISLNSTVALYLPTQFFLYIYFNIMFHNIKYLFVY